MDLNADIKFSTDSIFNKISKVVPEIEWKVHAPLIYKINKLKREKNSLILNYSEAEFESGLGVATNS